MLINNKIQFNTRAKMDDQEDKLYYRQYNWLKIYKCPNMDNMNSSVFHYFSEDVNGYQKTSLRCSTKPSRRPIKMYYQIDDTPITISRQKDQSAVIDFDFLQYQDDRPADQIILDQNAVVNESQWVRKYEPQNFFELLSDDKINRDLLAWLKSWNEHVFNIPNPKIDNQPKTPNMFSASKNYNKNREFHQQTLKAKNLILLAGPPGCGKTTLIRVIGNHCKYQVKEINASDDRSANSLIEKLQNFAGNQTIRKNQKPTFICIDQVDGAVDSQASGLSKVLDYIQNGKKQQKNVKKNKNVKTLQKQKQPNKNNNLGKTSSIYQKKQLINLDRPIIFICNDPFVKGLKQLRAKAHTIYFSPLATDKVVKRLKQICTKQKIYIEVQVLNKICEICKNDIRSCIGILQLIVKQKKIYNKSPKQIIDRMKLSFTKDNEATINQFISSLINKKKQAFNQETNIMKIQREFLEVSNTQLLSETFYHNLLGIKGIMRNPKTLLKLYDDLIYSDVLVKNSFKYRNQLDRYQVTPYINFALNFIPEENKKIEFPSSFFEKIKKKKLNKQILEKIYQALPLNSRIHFNLKTLVGNYLYCLFIGIQSPTTRDIDIGQSIMRMVTYGFTFKKQSDRHGYMGPIFHPEIDTLLTIGQKKPEYILSNSTKISMQENFNFYKQKKQLLSGLELRQTTENMINQLHLQSRKKRRNQSQFGIQYKFQQGTGTKITEKLTMKDFF